MLKMDVISVTVELNITKTRLFKFIENFTTKKGKFSDKKFRYFSYYFSKHRLPRRGSSNEYVFDQK